MRNKFKVVFLSLNGLIESSFDILPYFDSFVKFIGLFCIFLHLWLSSSLFTPIYTQGPKVIPQNYFT